MKWVVIVSAVLWAANIISTSFFYLNEFDAFSDGFRDLSGFIEVTQVISTVGYSFMLSATVIYLVLWLESRRYR